jgi:hypothetical protein
MMAANSSATTGATKENPSVTDLKKGVVMASVDDAPVQAPQHSSRPSPMMSGNTGATTSSPNSTKDPQSNMVTPTKPTKRPPKRPRRPPPISEQGGQQQRRQQGACSRSKGTDSRTDSRQGVQQQGRQQGASSRSEGTDSTTNSSPAAPSKGNMVTPTKLHSGSTTISPNSLTTPTTKDQEWKRPTKRPALFLKRSRRIIEPGGQGYSYKPAHIPARARAPSAIICCLCKEVLYAERNEEEEEDNKNYIFLSCPVCDRSFCKRCENRVVTPFFCDLCFRHVCDECAIECKVCGKSTCNDSDSVCRDGHVCE